MVSYEDFYLIILSWIVHKLLDFFWERNRAKLRFKGDTHFKRYLFVMFGEQLLMFMFGWLLGTPEDTEASEFQESVKGFAKLHRRYHEFIGNKRCAACYGIYWNYFLFERIVSNRGLAHERSKLFSECMIFNA
jgi:hypothetical protein